MWKGAVTRSTAHVCLWWKTRGRTNVLVSPMMTTHTFIENRCWCRGGMILCGLISAHECWLWEFIIASRVKSCLSWKDHEGQKKDYRYIAAGATVKTPPFQGKFKNVDLALATDGKDTGVAHEVPAEQLSGQHTLRLRCCQDIGQRHCSSDFQLWCLHCLLYSSFASMVAKASISAGEWQVLPREENVSQIHRHMHSKSWRAYQPSKRMCIRRPFLDQNSD
jgi:hypothetical protein